MGLASFPLSVKIRVTTKRTCTDSLWSLLILPSRPLILSYKMRNPSCQVPMVCKMAKGSLYVQSVVLLWREAQLWRFFHACLWSQTAGNGVCSLLPQMLLRQIVSRRKRTPPKVHWYWQSLFSAFVIGSPGLMALRTSCFDLARKEQDLEVTVGFQKRNLSGTWKSSSAQHPRSFNSLLARVLFEANEACTFTF